MEKTNQNEKELVDALTELIEPCRSCLERVRKAVERYKAEKGQFDKIDFLKSHRHLIRESKGDQIRENCFSRYSDYFDGELSQKQRINIEKIAAEGSPCKPCYAAVEWMLELFHSIKSEPFPDEYRVKLRKELRIKIGQSSE